MKGIRMPLSEAMKIHKRNGGDVSDLPIPKKKATKRSKLESDLAEQLKRLGVPEWKEEYKFHSVRDWRFDIAWPELKLAVEVDGLVHGGKGGHQTIDGITKDCEKHGEAILWGWTVYRCTNPMVKSGDAAYTVQRLITRLSNPS